MLPPRGFTPAGPLSRAERTQPPLFSTVAEETYRPPLSARFLKGLRYEAAVRSGVAAWADRSGVGVEFGPWFRFAGAPPGAWRWCQPDVVLDPGAPRPLLALEVKLQFEPRAWWQLRELYAPVVRLATGRLVNTAVVCGSFDPAVGARVPEPVALSLGVPSQWLAYWLADSTEVSTPLPVLQWRRPGSATLE